MAAAAFKLQMVLGEAVRPYRRTFERIEALWPKLADDEESFALLADWFAPASDEPGQVSQAAERRALARAWSVERGGAVPAWVDLLTDPATADE